MLSASSIRYRLSTPPFRLAVLLGLTGLLFRGVALQPAASPAGCTLGIVKAETVKIDRNRGEVRFKIKNESCPSGKGGQLEVVAMILDLAGDLAVSWSPSNITNRDVPNAGEESDPQTLKFNVSGAGQMVIRLHIINCNGLGCEDQKWEIAPNFVTTNPVYFP
jgi:hypothetical protein